MSAGGQYPHHAVDLSELMRVADAAMYRATKRGRDRQFPNEPGTKQLPGVPEAGALA